MSDPRVEWVNSIQLVEVAEAVKTTTELVMAVHSDGLVLYTPEDTEEIWFARLDRDADGILVAGPGQFMATFDDFHARMSEGIEAKLKEMEDRGELPPRQQ